MMEEQRLIGRWIGITHRAGSDITYWVLTKSGRVIARLTVQHVTTLDMQQDAIQQLQQEFDASVTERFADEHFVLLEPGLFYLKDVKPPEQIDDFNAPDDAEYGDMIQEPQPDVDTDTNIRYLNAEVMINQDGEPLRA